jgi:hypothetical protein
MMPSRHGEVKKSFLVALRWLFERISLWQIPKKSQLTSGFSKKAFGEINTY